MSSTSVAGALLRQVDAVLQLVEALTPSLSIEDIANIRYGLALALDGVRAALEERTLEAEGVALAGKFFHDSLATSI